MKQKKIERLRIIMIASAMVKSVRDRMSGILRYAAVHNLPWSISIYRQMPLPYFAVNNPELEGEDGGPIDGMIIPAERLAEMNRNCQSRHAAHVVVISTDSDEDVNIPANAVRLAIGNADYARTAADLLIKRGLGHFAYVHTPFSKTESPVSLRRGEAFKTYLREKGFDCAICARRAVRGNWAVRLRHLADELAALQHPCGVLAYNDERARAVIDACNLAGLKIPEQIQVVGVDNEIEICESVRPRLTSVDPDFVGVGIRAAELLDQLIRNGRKTMQGDYTYGSCSIVERDTTIDLKGSARLVTAAQNIIRDKACGGLTPSELADMLKVSRRLLEMRFREVLDTGVAEAIRSEKLKEVCRRLKETGRPIGEISYACGFETPTHLKALFRNTFGMTMREWRHQPGHSSSLATPFVTGASKSPQ